MCDFFTEPATDERITAKGPNPWDTLVGIFLTQFEWGPLEDRISNLKVDTRYIGDTFLFATQTPISVVY